MDALTTAIKFKSKGKNVSLLHKALKLAKVNVAGSDVSKAYFGIATRNAIMQFQKAKGIRATGVLEAKTVNLLNALLKKEHDTRPVPPPVTPTTQQKAYLVQGTITGKDDKPLVGLKAIAYHYNLGHLEFLGETTTNAKGYYRITYTKDDFKNTTTANEKANIIVKVQGKSGKVVGTSKRQKNAPQTLKFDFKINYVIRESVKVSKTNEVTQKIADGIKVLPSLGSLGNDKLYVFAAAPTAAKQTIIKQWETEGVSANKIKSLEGATELIEATKENAPLLEMLGKDGITTSRDLVKYDVKTLGKNIASNTNIPEKGKAAEALALDVLKTAEKKNPSAFFMDRLIQNPQKANINKALIKTPPQSLKTFYSKNKDFDLLREPIISKDTGLLNKKIKHTGAVSPELVKNLGAAQQAIQLGKDSDLSLLLYSKDITISKAMQMSYTGLMKTAGIDAFTAIQVKERAQTQHESALNGFMAYRDVLGNPLVSKTLGSFADVFQTLKNQWGKNWEAVAKANGLKDLDSIEDLFGAQNFCDCKHCKSVLSPAAYFVDLMRFIETRVLKKESTGEKRLEESHPIHLKTRRPDLWNIPLTCEKSNTNVPYIGIVVEVLSKFIKSQLGTSKTVEDRLAQELPDKALTLPYNHPLQSVRTWLEHFNVTRLEVLKYIYPSPNAAQQLIIAQERLNLSKESYALITKANHTAIIHNDVLEFRTVSGLSAEDTEAFAKLYIWRSKLKIQQIKTATDLQTMRLEFKSSLPKWQGIFHQIFRLWQSSKLSLADFDILCRSFGVTYAHLNKATILKFSEFLMLSDVLEHDIKTTASIVKGIQFKWDELAPDNWTVNRKITLQELQEGTTDAAIELSLQLQAIYGISSTEIIDCVEMLSTSIAAGANNTITFSLLTLNTLYLHIELYKWTDVQTIKDFKKIMTIWGQGTFKPFNNAIPNIKSFCAFIKDYAAYGFTTEAIIYLFDRGAIEATVLAENKTYLTAPETLDLIASDDFMNGDKFLVLFNNWLGIDKTVLDYYKNFLIINETQLKTLLNSLNTSNVSDNMVRRFSNVKLNLERLQYLVSLTGINHTDLLQLSTEAQSHTYPKFKFSAWYSMPWVKGFAILSKWINETVELNNFNLWEVLSNIEKDNRATETFENAFKKWKNISPTEVAALIEPASSIFKMEKMLQHVDWVKRLHINHALFPKLEQNATLSAIKAQDTLLQEAIRSSYSDTEAYEAAIKSTQAKLNSKFRDALATFVVHNKAIRNKKFGFKTINDLYDYFLLDIGMGDCFELPCLVVATNTLQTYINRCLLGLEVSADEKQRVILDLDERDEWEWRKNYRVWEANRKIFLFPENYIEPEIRDNKTPEFKILEDELVQQKLDLDVVENAYKKYIHGVMKLAELKIAGAYLDEGETIYLFGRTNTQPHEYYWRTVELLDDGGRIWSNWIKMNIAIPTEDVSAVRINNKLYVFWTTYQRRDVSLITGGDQELYKHVYDVTVNYTHQKLDGSWIEAQTIDLGFRKSSKFDPYLRIDAFENLVLDSNTSDPSFAAEAEEIRENVLKKFQKVVYRKPYPTKLRSDSNDLSLDFIWSDKENALETRYRYTRAVYDAFEVDVKIKIKRDWWFDGEIDITFHFKRFDRIVLWPTTAGQEDPPTSFTIPDQTRTFTIGDDTLKFKVEFDTTNFRYYITPKSSAGNDMYFFKNLNEVANGTFEVRHQIDHIPIASVKMQNHVIDISHQSLKTQGPEISINTVRNTKANRLKDEYDLYYDSFNSFYIGEDNRVVNKNYSIQSQREFVAELNVRNEAPIGLNPEGLQMLWRKVSVSINELLHHKTQRFVKDQVDYNESFGNYFFEVFFHIPMRIADHLNAAGKFREADVWYRYVYDPTNTKDEFEQLAFPADVNWNFTAFTEIGIEKLSKIYSDENAIEQYKRNPGNPHAIARMRISAYQKNVVMKYLDNLLDWGDYLFEQYLPESTSEARAIYQMVKHILGDKPKSTGACKEAPEMTYGTINFALNEATGEFIYNVFRKVPVYSDGQRKPGRTREKEKDQFAGFLDKKAGLKTLNYKSNTHDTKTYRAYKDSRFTNKDVSSYKRLATYKGTGASVKVKKPLERKPFEETYGRPRTPVKYINVKSDLIFCFPNNDMFLEYWDRVDDRIYKLNNCLDINGVKREMPAYAPPIDPALLASLAGNGIAFDDLLAMLNSKLPNHRFTFLIEKAKQFCSTAQNFGNTLLAAIEKKDNEELTQLRTRHEQNLLLLTSRAKQTSLEQAQNGLNVLLENKVGIENRIAHYEALISEGLIPWEQTEQIAKYTAGGIRIGEGVLQLLSGGLRLVPQLGSPFAMKYGGLELGDSANRFANALDATAKIADNIAMLAGMEASNQRREQEWQFQLDNATQELVGLEQQIANAELSIQLAEYDIELHDKNIAQYQELYDFYMNKFSNLQHYTFQVGQLQTLHKLAYNLAYNMAADAQRAYNFERGLDLATPGVIVSTNWNAEKVGLHAGDNLLVQLQQLEKDFIDTDVVTKQITQHFSLKQIDPEKLLELKVNGSFNGFTIPEAAFDVIYPGYYRRRIKSISISMPCIVGPYTNVGATLTLESSKIRKDTNGALEDFAFNGNTMIVTSTAQRDGGQFDLSFNGSKYLPFEGAGAISTWALALPNTVRAFDYNSIADIIFHVSYEAEYDGLFQATVEGNLKTQLERLNGTKSLRILSLKHDFPNDWHLLHQSSSGDVTLQLQREHFPYFSSLVDFESVEAFSYVVNADGTVEKKNDSQGITKASAMQLTIPKALSTQNYKDVIFFTSYKV